MNRPMSKLALRAFAGRARTVVLAAAVAFALSACNQTDDLARKANMPLSPQMLSLIAQKDMVPASPILVRIFKQESELEVWKETTSGRYALLKTYPICRWSGELGPKVRMGDRQAPEGFYAIAPGQMNPNSNYYLSFNLGFPNAYDKAYGRTGEFLMVHGDCSSAGCYAMTDEQIAEIFSLARESFAGGQRSFQVQAYPFRMTPKNLARHRNNPNMAFWKNLKEGNDHFLVTGLEPKVNVCNRRYVFDAMPEPGRGFDANQSCPSYQVPDDISRAVAAKEKADDAKVAALVPNVQQAPVRTNSDGGMHPVFLAKFKERESGQLSFAQAPGTLPEYVNPPRETPEKKLLDSQTEETVGILASAPRETTAGSGGTAAPAATPAPAAVAAAPELPRPAEAAAPQPPERPTATASAAAPKPQAKSATSTASAKPAPPRPPAATAKPTSVASASANTLTPPGTLMGGSNILSTSSFSQ